MDYKVVPFVAQITQKDTTETVAGQLQTLINEHSSKGWEYVRLENVETQVAADNGCFGIGVITKDNVGTEINAIIYFQITDPVKAIYEISNLPDAIEKLTQTTLRNVIGELDLDQTLTSRDTINGKLRAVLDDAGHKWGVKVNRVELQDINPPQEIRAAMEKQMRAERDKRAKVLEAEGDKQSQILQSEGLKEAKINNAEGEKQSQILRAEGEAQARIRTAQGEAEAIQKITQAIATTKSDPVNYLIAVRYIDKLGEMVSGKDNKVIYMPYEATGILSSIGGIKDLLTATNK